MDKKGILIISHGSRDSHWVKLVDDLVNDAVDAIVEQEQDMSQITIRSVFLELVEGRLIQDGVDELEQLGVKNIYVVPLFISSGSTHVEEIRQAFGFAPTHDFIGDLDPIIHQSNIHFSAPIGVEREVIEILLQHVLDLSSDGEHESILFIGHGSSDSYFYEKWSMEMEVILGQLAKHLGSRPLGFASLLPERVKERFVQLQEQEPEHSILVIPIFLSKGYFTNIVIPQRLSGLHYSYTSEGLLPSEKMVQLLTRRLLLGIRMLK